MWLTGANLKNFRNLKEINVSLSKGVNIIYGRNAQGKTNFLESIYYCSMGRSLRTSHERELICFGENEARLGMGLVKGGSERAIDAQIIYESGKTSKNFNIDKLHIAKTSELFGLLLIVMFSPEDLSLIKAGPSERRTFMDRELCQISPVYTHELRCYHKVLKQRNNLLKKIKKEIGDGKAYKKSGDTYDLDSLDAWDGQLCRYGRKIMVFRSDFITEISIYAAETHGRLTGGGEYLKVIYNPDIDDGDLYEQVIAKNRSRDIQMGSTTSGAHKDDITFLINGQDARVYGSQGQKRTAALSAKLAEIETIKENTGNTPVLLLDDVLSELDEHRQEFLLSKLGEMQTILACTGVEDIIKKKHRFVDNTLIMRMEVGVLS